MPLNWKIKRFEALSAAELYQVMQLRSEVFVVEQNCVYQDVDGKDPRAVHLIGEFDGEIIAYARLFGAGEYFVNASIGRVVIDKRFRDRKWGYELMNKAIEAVKDYFEASKISISAQLYLKRFYEKLGFVQIGEQYLEDGIPHIPMERE